ncbi:Ctf8-domain-containing protein [Amylocarpus encephaloides]|uniref:Ctf8-domain-containing protein n=1 Tax=Amylocarpus encephaloides TaxID=45428 RepID=A0A9P7YJK3_9HELO|nr:Ctf8-domain-containing protein [Amylocarpus encephaloides]
MDNPITLQDSRAATSLPENVSQNPLPQLLQTPTGLALLELQGTINLPSHNLSLEAQSETSIGRLIFPEYDAQDKASTAWMKRVYMYVGKHQRLTGEVKRLPKAIAVIRKKTDGSQSRIDPDGGAEQDAGIVEDLEIVEIVKYKIIFSSRPEPVGVYEAGT